MNMPQSVYTFTFDEHFLFGSYYGQSYLNFHIQVFMWPLVFVSLKEISRRENDGSYMIGLCLTLQGKIKQFSKVL